jgi:predicted membrane-bound mannosyltransferase
MKTKIERAAEIHRTMTPRQMALHIVELQDALELAEEAVRAKQFPVVPDGWQLVPVDPTSEMALAATNASLRNPAINGVHQYRAMLAAAPKLVG